MHPITSASADKTLNSESGGFDPRRSGAFDQATIHVASSPEAPASEPVAPSSAARRLPRSELVALLAHSLGRERSEELITAAARKLRIDAAAFNRDEALRILAELAATPGVVGVTAKFAKARCVLRFPV
jgi:hypothetical protein